MEMYRESRVRCQSLCLHLEDVNKLEKEWVCISLVPIQANGNLQFKGRVTKRVYISKHIYNILMQFNHAKFKPQW